MLVPPIFNDMRALLLIGMLLGPVLTLGQSWDSLYLDLHPDTTTSQYLNDAVSDGSQGLMAVGNFRPTNGSWSGYVVRYDPNGDTLWTQRFPGVRSFHAIGSAGNGTYLLAAETQNSSIDPPLILIDANGNVEWQKSYDPAFPQGGLLPYDLLTDDNGGAWVIGRKFWNQVGKWVVVRTDANGDTLWSQSTE
ncbi:MAG: hypothetical protein AAGB22_12145, partial [Bacteroidota bacterium]